MNSKILWLVLVLLAVAGFVFYLLSTRSSQVATQTVEQNTSIKAVFNCSGGKSIVAEFNNVANNVNLQLSDDRTMTLPQAMSASGARFANADESFVFWNKGDTAFIEENGQSTFTDCLTTAIN